MRLPGTPAIVYVTAGGHKFHARPDCSYLLQGQAAAVERDDHIHPIRSVGWLEATESHRPCRLRVPMLLGAESGCQRPSEGNAPPPDRFEPDSAGHPVIGLIKGDSGDSVCRSLHEFVVLRMRDAECRSGLR